MLEEKYIAQQLLGGTTNHTVVNEIVYKEDTLRVGLHVCRNDEKEKKLNIYFNYVLSFKNTDESYLLKTIEEQVKHKNFKWGETFYLVENSSYINWFNEQSVYIPRDTGVAIKHYAIYTSNDCIDILASVSPNIEWLD